MSDFSTQAERRDSAEGAVRQQTEGQAEAVTQSQTQKGMSVRSSSSSSTQGREKLTGQGTHLDYTGRLVTGTSLTESS